MADARFEDADETPLRLRAEDPQDLSVISALVQDAVAQTSEMSWMPGRRRFAMLLNRFRWEDHQAATTTGRPLERVQSILVIEDVHRVQSSGIDPADKDLVLAVLSLAFWPGEDGTGRLDVVFSGDGTIAFEVEALGVALKDVSRPYEARAQRMPEHGS